MLLASAGRVLSLQVKSEQLREWSFFNNSGGGVGGFLREQVEIILAPPTGGVEIFLFPLRQVEI